jgi:hypothetical protein
MSQYRYCRVCKRCGVHNYYVHESSAILTENDSKCNYCKGIPDDVLHFFVNNRLYMRHCPNCNRLLQCKNKLGLLARIRENLPCHFCTAKKINKEISLKRRSEWKHVVGTMNVSSKKLYKIMQFWQSMTDDQKSEHHKRSDQQKIYFWSHLSRMNKSIGLIRLRKSFEKYRGKNHWMKRPEVYAKIKRTCRKYRGDGHWFRRNKI